MEDDLQRALGKALGRVELRLPSALVPEHDRTAAVLSLGNQTLEVRVLDGMVLDHDGQALVAGIVGGSLGHGPAQEDPLPLQAKVVVHPRGDVILDYEFEGPAPLGAAAPRGFPGAVEVSLLTIFG